MAQVLAAAWVGIMVGWIGFGWVLAEAPSDSLGAHGMRVASSEQVFGQNQRS